MSRWVYRPGHPKADEFNMVAVEDLNEQPIVRGPHIWSDLPDYQSPIDGRCVSGRVQRREDLKRNDCVEYEPTKNAPRGFKNAEFCRRRGLTLSPTEE